MNHCQWAMTKCAGTHSATGATDGWYRQQLRPGKDSGAVWLGFSRCWKQEGVFSLFCYCSIIDMWLISICCKKSSIFSVVSKLKMKSETVLPPRHIYTFTEEVVLLPISLKRQERIASLGGGVAKIKAETGGGTSKIIENLVAWCVLPTWKHGRWEFWDPRCRKCIWKYHEIHPRRLT